MYIVDIIPITKGIGKERLSYFTSKTFEAGSIISVPLRKKKVLGLITNVRDARLEKAKLRSSDFAMRKVTARSSQKILSPLFIQTAHACADFFASSTGALLNATTPSSIIKNISDIDEINPSLHKQEDIKHPSETFVIQGDVSERYAHYKSQIREHFAKGSSVIFVLPTIREIQNLSNTFKKGIEHYTYTFHSGIKPEDVIKMWNEIVKNEHPVLIIMTGSFLSVPRHDVGVIIVEHESNNAYKMPARPYCDFRIVAEIYAQTHKIPIIFGDTILRTETVWRERTGDAIALSTLKFRTPSRTKLSIIDMREPSPLSSDQHNTSLTKNSSEKTSFSVFSNEVLDDIEKTVTEGGRMLLFCARKGLAPTTVCSDCGTTVTCSSCNTPLVLRTLGTKNMHTCHKCNTVRDADENCSVCTSWNLRPLGIGTERVIEDLITLGVPEESIFRIDSDKTKTHLQVQKEMGRFVDSNRSLLVGTQMALPYLPTGGIDLGEKIENAAIISIDSLLSIPDFRMNEKVLHIITQLRLRIHKHLLIQTRLSDQSIFQDAVAGDLLRFFQDEIEQRKQFNYPPFTRFVKISLWGPKQRVEKRMEELSTYLEAFTPITYPAFTTKIKGKYGMHILLKVPRENWPDKDLLELLRALPQEYTIDIEPQSIL